MSSLSSLHVGLPPPTFLQRLFAATQAEIRTAPAVQQSSAEVHPNRNTYARTMVGLVRFVDELSRAPWVTPEHAPAPSAAHAHSAGIRRRYFVQLPSFVAAAGQLSAAHTYDEHITLFRQACGNLRLLQHDPPGKATSDTHSSAANIPADVFDALCAQIAEQSQTATVRAAIAQRRHETQQRFEEYGDYIAASLSARHRLVIIQLDLGYTNDPAHPISLSLAERDLQRFLGNRHHNQAFRGWVGYVARLTYSASEGFGWRLLVLFDGLARDGYDHVHIADSLGQYWQKVVAPQRGRFRNGISSSAYGLGSASPVLGPLQDGDKQALGRLANSILFELIKPLQFMRPKVDERFKVVRRGQMPPRDPNAPPRRRKR